MTSKLQRLLAEADDRILDVRVCADAARNIRTSKESADAFLKVAQAARGEIARTLQLALDEVGGRKAAR